MPLSACLGRAEVFDRWPTSTGEALHTQTFLGHPAGCAAALATIAVIEEEKLVDRSRELGESALARLRARLDGRAAARGRGLLLGVECAARDGAVHTCRRALEAGVIALPSGDDGRCVAISPPLTIEPEILELALDRLAEAVR
jgi:4-aminobutyrate aminotransferase/(S)-3-amino-2-methylpropionate transaminase